MCEADSVHVAVSLGEGSATSPDECLELSNCLDSVCQMLQYCI